VGSLHALLIELFIIVAIIGVRSLGVGIFFNLPTPTASRWVSTMLLVGSNLLSTVSQPLIPTSVRVHMFADILFGVSVMQHLYLHCQGSLGEKIAKTAAGYLLASAYLICLVFPNIITPLIFTLEVMLSPLNKIHVCTPFFSFSPYDLITVEYSPVSTVSFALLWLISSNSFQYYLGSITAIFLFLLGSPLFLSPKPRVQMIMLL
jgi:hypothetical protein